MKKYLVLILTVASISGEFTDIFSGFDEFKALFGNISLVLNCAFNGNQSCSKDTEKPKLDYNASNITIPLLLTSYLEEGRLEEARAASRVNPELFLGFESYSGFLTVDKEYKSNLFFWYFPALNPAPVQPWLIWLQGGPGASSLFGLFAEIGPFSVEQDPYNPFDVNLKRNLYTWLHNHSLVFIDNPVGTGFSFTEHPDGFVTDMATCGKHLHLATQQLVQIYPELKEAPLYVAGESYAGKYIPALGIEIHRQNKAPGDVNLKGFVMGNAFVEPGMIAHLPQTLFHFGHLEKEQLAQIQPLVQEYEIAIAANKSVEASEKWNNMYKKLKELSHFGDFYNFIHERRDLFNCTVFLNKAVVKRALHVAERKFYISNGTVRSKLETDFLSSSRADFEELLEHYRVLAYCGQLDMMVPCAPSSEIYREWRWSSYKEFLEAPRDPYVLDNQHVGYVKTGGGLTWVVVRGAGHMVPMDTPRPALHLVSSWTHQLPLPAWT